MLVRRVYVFKKDFKVSRLHGLRDLVGASALTTVSLLCPDPVLAEPATVSANDPYVFDDNMMFGNGSLSRFNRINAVEPGQYKVDLFINRRFVDRVDLRFASQGNGDVQPCLSEKLLESSGVLKSAIHTTDDNQCLILSQAIHGASTAFDFSILRLDLSIPQSLMINTPRGYVPTQSLDAGSLMGFVNYSANQYHVTRSGKNNSSTDSSYLSLNSGLNVGLWRLRQQGNWRYDNDYGSHWNTTRTYAQRALPGIKGDLTAGQGFTSGRFFQG